MQDPTFLRIQPHHRRRPVLREVPDFRRADRDERKASDLANRADA